MEISFKLRQHIDKNKSKETNFTGFKPFVFNQNTSMCAYLGLRVDDLGLF